MTQVFVTVTALAPSDWPATGDHITRANCVYEPQSHSAAGVVYLGALVVQVRR